MRYLTTAILPVVIVYVRISKGANKYLDQIADSPKIREMHKIHTCNYSLCSDHNYIFFTAAHLFASSHAKIFASD